MKKQLPRGPNCQYSAEMNLRRKQFQAGRLGERREWLDLVLGCSFYCVSLGQYEQYPEAVYGNV